MPATPSIALSMRMPCQWTEVGSSSSLMKRTLTRSPCFTRISGPGRRSLYSHRGEGPPLSPYSIASPLTARSSMKPSELLASDSFGMAAVAHPARAAFKNVLRSKSISSSFEQMRSWQAYDVSSGWKVKSATRIGVRVQNRTHSRVHLQLCSPTPSDQDTAHDFSRRCDFPVTTCDLCRK